uniref:Uncharacterized protein n=1 Tax=Setaria italica TaxID=4555 RepID=K3YC40_SETIT
MEDVSSPLRVYSRQRRRARASSPPAAPDSQVESSLATPIQRLSRVCKSVDKLLPQPVIQKHWKKAPLPGSLPCRSRHVVATKPCLPGPAVTDAQKTQDSYSKLYKPLLSDSHVSAMAAIFGWTVGEGDEVRSTEVLAML